MSKYIDADKLIAEIERLAETLPEARSTMEGLLSLIDSLQQEQTPTEREIAEAHHYAEMIRERDRARIQQEQPDNWNDGYREDELLTRFAFYTYKDEDSVLYLSNVFVEETSRNKGFGTKILQAAEKVAETIGAITIRLKAKRNSQANDWYRKHGYRYLTFEGEYDWLEKNLEYLKPKQEQPEVDLEKELDSLITPELKKYKALPSMMDVAKHFYELGLNARKEENK